jgi:F0F1-type ATP synthase assembly protein I
MVASGGQQPWGAGRIALGLLYVGSINVVSIVAGVGAGYGLDQLTGTTPLFLFLGLGLGILIGVVGTWRVVRDYLRA